MGEVAERHFFFSVKEGADDCKILFIKLGKIRLLFPKRIFPENSELFVRFLENDPLDRVSREFGVFAVHPKEAEFLNVIALDTDDSLRDFGEPAGDVLPIRMEIFDLAEPSFVDAVLDAL